MLKHKSWYISISKDLSSFGVWDIDYYHWYQQAVKGLINLQTQPPECLCQITDLSCFYMMMEGPAAILCAWERVCKASLILVPYPEPRNIMKRKRRINVPSIIVKLWHLWYGSSEKEMDLPHLIIQAWCTHKHVWGKEVLVLGVCHQMQYLSLSTIPELLQQRHLVTKW